MMEKNTSIRQKKRVPRSITDDNLRVIKNKTWARVDMQFLFRVFNSIAHE